MTPSRALLVLGLVGSLLSGCAADPADTKLQLPDLTGVEQPVARRILTRHAKAVQTPTRENLLAYARALHTHGMLAPAAVAYRKAQASSSGDARFEPLYLEAVAISATDQERAITMLDAAIALRPDYVAAYLLRGRLLESQERFKEAAKGYEQAMAKGGANHAQLGLGRVLLAQGKPKAALQHLEAAARIAPDHREVFEALARCYARLDRTADSDRAARKVGDLDRPTPYQDELQVQLGDENVSTEVRVHRAGRLARSGQAAEAIREFQAVLAVRPKHIEAHDYMALLLQKDRPRQALTHLDTILAVRPDYARALELRARILLRFNQRARAKIDLRNLLKVQPDHAWAKSQLK